LEDFLLFVAVGFAAQLIDGAIGMAYGVTATTVLLSFGTPPAVASASVHTAEVVTTAISGISHWRFGNIDWSFVRNLVVPGMLGGALGAYLLATLPAELMRPIVTTYLLCVGIVIVVKALRGYLTETRLSAGGIRILGFFGGFLDASGGGGWGPLVTSTLIGRGAKPRFAIGSTNLAEFFITVTIATTFAVTIGVELLPIITGLIVGGGVAAPLAAYVTRRLPDRAMMVLVGVIIALLSLHGLLQTVL
jgi:uncharacterized membrane protein YfcA